MKKPRPSTAAGIGRAPSKTSAALTAQPDIRYVDTETEIPAVPCTIHAPVNGGIVMSDRAYVMINVLPGKTSAVVRTLSTIPQIKTIDPCWGKPDIIIQVEVQDQDALTQLVLSRIHEIEGVSQTETHLVYRLQDSTAA
ncbi:MAG: Lrp/AsnC ligand binding domain-containing protein [Nitrospira sp.]|nr:Lrp/AsnC ligand binding domain-containing protein [Nitrospira sp.]